MVKPLYTEELTEELTTGLATFLGQEPGTVSPNLMINLRFDYNSSDQTAEEAMEKVFEELQKRLNYSGNAVNIHAATYLLELSDIEGPDFMSDVGVTNIHSSVIDFNSPNAVLYDPIKSHEEEAKSFIQSIMQYDKDGKMMERFRTILECDIDPIFYFMEELADSIPNNKPENSK